MFRPRTTAALLLASTLVVAGCGSDDETTDGIDLGSSATRDDTAAGDDDPAVADEDAVDDPTVADDDDDAAGDATTDDPDEAAAGEPTGAGDTGTLADLTLATTGTWPVGDAGTVTFDVVDGALVLLDVDPAEGWQHVIDEEDDDEIEVDFRRGDERWELEVELQDDRSRLEIELRYDLDDAPSGSYDLGQAGTFAFEVQGDRLVLTSLDPADGWDVVTREEDDDELEIDLVSGDRRVDVEVELDDGRVELEIDLTLVGPVER